MFNPLPESILDSINEANGAISGIASSVADTDSAKMSPSVDTLKSFADSLQSSVESISSTIGSAINPDKAKALIASIQKTLEGIDINTPAATVKAKMSQLVNQSSQVSAYVDDASGNFELTKIFSEVQKYASTIGNYATNVSSYLFDPDTNPVPQSSDTIGDISFDTMLERAQKAKDGLGGFAVGSINDSVYKAAGAIRENGMASMSKTALYQSAMIDFGGVQTDLSAQTGKTVNFLRGTAPGQNSII